VEQGVHIVANRGHGAGEALGTGIALLGVSRSGKTDHGDADEGCLVRWSRWQADRVFTGKMSLD